MRTIPLWLGYVDDTFSAVLKDEIDDFHEHLDKQNADKQFTKESEENNKIPRFGHSRQHQTTNDNLQKTDTYQQLTRPVSVQPDLSQGFSYADFDETMAISVRLA